MVDRRFFLKGNVSRSHSFKFCVKYTLVSPTHEGTRYEIYQEIVSKYSYIIYIIFPIWKQIVI